MTTRRSRRSIRRGDLGEEAELRSFISRLRFRRVNGQSPLGFGNWGNEETGEMCEIEEVGIENEK